MKPKRVQLSRRKGWRMPPNTIKVDRTTRWGNPFVVGVHGTRADCVRWLELTLAGFLVLGFRKDEDGQYVTDKADSYRKMVKRDRRLLIGKNLACWCPADQPCHADILLRVAEKARRDALRGDKGE